MKTLATLALALALAAPLLAAPALVTQARAELLETEFADPKPDFMEPRQIMLQMSTGDEAEINNILWNAINLQKAYGTDNVVIAVIAFGPGMRALYRDSPVRERIESQLSYGIRFVGCGNTMETTDRDPDELIEGVDYVQAGIAEIVERQLRGWTYVRP
jgi:intracellular sulfur oxidation DsrE/DsrF family protein